MLVLLGWLAASVLPALVAAVLPALVAAAAVLPGLPVLHLECLSCSC